MSVKHAVCAALWAAFLLVAPAMAAVYRAEGVASLEVGRIAARQLAVDDGVRQMAMTHAGTLSASSEVDSGRLSEGVLTGPLTLPGATRILSETERDGLLIVTVELDTAKPAAGVAATPSAPSAPDNPHACARPQAPAGRFLSRRLVSTYFEIVQPQDASDLGNLATWLPTSLTRRLNTRRDVRALDAGSVSLFPGGRMQEAWQAADAVRDIGRREEVQFVLAARVLDTAVSRTEPRVAAFGNAATGGQGAYYTGPFAGLLGLSARVVPVERRFTVEYWLYDALSGGVLSAATVTRTARGNVHEQSLRTFDSRRFEQDDYGRVVGEALDEMADKVATTMHCLPFAARVVRLDGDKAYLGAGSLDGLATGDRLIVYRLQPQTEMRRSDGMVLGMPETTAGDVELVQVQPRFAIAMVRNVRGRIAVGDWVRFPARP